MSDLRNPDYLRELAKVARSSELHDLKIGLEPEYVDEIADTIEQLQRDYAKAQHKIGEYVDLTAKKDAEIERLREGVTVIQVEPGMSDKYQAMAKRVEVLEKVQEAYEATLVKIWWDGDEQSRKTASDALAAAQEGK